MIASGGRQNSIGFQGCDGASRFLAGIGFEKKYRISVCWSRTVSLAAGDDPINEGRKFNISF